MAGSYNHVVSKNGGLDTNKHVVGMLENGGDVFEAVEEMYGMIWYLARKLERAEGLSATDIVEEARTKYKEGLSLSPTKRYKEQ
jgi:hypothetical protein